MNSVFAVAATIISIISFFPYLKDLQAKKIKPHLFSWLIWSLMTSVYFFVQVNGGAGIGALTTFVTGVITIYITVISIKYSDKLIKKIDVVSLVISIIALVSWIATNNPLYAVFLVSLADFTGFLPTVRKSYQDPESETLSLYLMAGIKHVLVIFSLETLSLATSFYTFFLIAENFLFVSMLLIRRRQIQKK